MWVHSDTNFEKAKEREEKNLPYRRILNNMYKYSLWEGGFSSCITPWDWQIVTFFQKIYIKERGKQQLCSGEIWQYFLVQSMMTNVTSGVLRISCNLWHDMIRKSLHFCCILLKNFVVELLLEKDKTDSNWRMFYRISGQYLQFISKSETERGH